MVLNFGKENNFKMDIYKILNQFFRKSITLFQKRRDELKVYLIYLQFISISNIGVSSTGLAITTTKTER